MWQLLDQTRQWLWLNPPNGVNATQRREWMAHIQAACDQLSVSDYRAYMGAWSGQGQEAERFEEKHAALHYLRASNLHAMEDIHRTRVGRGVALCLLYNMGYVVRTPKACFRIDLCGRDVEQLAPDLDFLLVSHEHPDHVSKPLINAMLVQRKPVLTRWLDGTTIVTQSGTFDLHDIRVRVDIGDHHWKQEDQRDNMLMFEIDCGTCGNGAVIYHGGDGSNLEKMHPEKPIDVFIVHVAVGLSVPQAIKHLQPKMTLVSHVMELTHSILPPQACDGRTSMRLTSSARYPRKMRRFSPGVNGGLHRGASLKGRVEVDAVDAQ